MWRIDGATSTRMLDEDMGSRSIPHFRYSNEPSSSHQYVSIWSSRQRHVHMGGVNPTVVHSTLINFRMRGRRPRDG